MTGGTAAETTATPETPTDDPTTAQKIAAEVLGTFVLVLFGCGAAVMSGGDYVTTGLSFGLAVLVMAAAFGRISGGHFNPAVTLGAALAGRLAWRETPVYVGAQLLGAILAGACLLGLLSGFPGFGHGDSLGQNAFGDESAAGYVWWAALLLELLMTLVFIFVVLGVTDARNSTLAALAPIAIGLALAGIHFASMSATGTSVNPARSIGVALFVDTDAIVQLWLFVVAPLLGAAIAGTTYPLLFGQGAAPVPGSGLSSRPRAPKAQQLPGYGQPAPGAAWAGVAGQPHPGQPQPQPGQWGAPPQPQPGQWGAAPDPQWGQSAPTQTRQPYQEQGYPPPPPQQQPPAGQPGQWGAPQQQPPQQQGWGAPPPPDEEDGRTQIRPGG